VEATAISHGKSSEHFPALLTATYHGIHAMSAMATAAAAGRQTAGVPVSRQATQVAEANARATASAPVRALANRLGVRLGDVSGTGAGGRITTRDVHAAAPRRGPATLAAVPSAASAERSRVAAAANEHVTAPTNVRELANHLGVQLRDVYAAGVSGATGMPTESDVRAQAGRLGLPGAASTAPPLPAFTASGIDPRALLDFPAPVRPAMAAAESRAEAYALGQRYAGMTDELAAQALATDLTVPPDQAHAWATATGFRYWEPGSPSVSGQSVNTSTGYSDLDRGAAAQTQAARSAVTAMRARQQSRFPDGGLAGG